jgi:hypothetical protein
MIKLSSINEKLSVASIQKKKKKKKFIINEKNIFFLSNKIFYTYFKLNLSIKFRPLRISSEFSIWRWKGDPDLS